MSKVSVYGIQVPPGGWPVKPPPSPEVVARLATRKKGFYHVKIWDEWTIGEWDGKVWIIVGSEEDFKDDEFQEINETLISEKP